MGSATQLQEPQDWTEHCPPRWHTSDMTLEEQRHRLACAEGERVAKRSQVMPGLVTSPGTCLYNTSEL